MSNTYSRTATGFTFSGHLYDNTPFPQYIANPNTTWSVSFRSVASSSTATASLYSNGSNSYILIANAGTPIVLNPGSGNQFYTVDIKAAVTGASQTWNGSTGGNDDIVIIANSNSYTGVPISSTFLTLDGTLDYFRDSNGLSFTAESYDIGVVSPADSPLPTKQSWIDFEGGDAVVWSQATAQAWNLGNQRLTGFRFRVTVTNASALNLKVWCSAVVPLVCTWRNLTTGEVGNFDLVALSNGGHSYLNVQWFQVATQGTFGTNSTGTYEFGVYYDEWFAGNFLVNNIAICGGGTLVSSTLSSRDMIGFSGDSIFSQQGNQASGYVFEAMPWGIMWAQLLGVYGLYVRAGNGATVATRNTTDNNVAPFWSKTSLWTGLVNQPKWLFLEPGTNDSYSAAHADTDQAVCTNLIGNIGDDPATYFSPADYTYIYNLINGLANTRVVRLQFLQRTDSPTNNNMITFINSWNATYATQYRFTMSGVTTAPSVGATYTNNGITFTVTLVGSLKTSMYCTASGDPQTSGTLTKTGGTGDSTITFSRWEHLALPNWNDYMTSISRDVMAANAKNTVANGGNGNQAIIIYYADLVNLYGFSLPSSGFLHPPASPHTIYQQMVNWMIGQGMAIPTTTF